MDTASTHEKQAFFALKSCILWFKKIVLYNGIPFELRLPSLRPVSIESITRADLDRELMKGVESLKAGKGYTADEVDAILSKEFGI